ncbi:MAG: glutamine synthetase family protein [Candidatus Amulumruptor caecigallinarius]|nr:glutamine synthetase family protein [Candidatus Amulumruptor caecigallinarius]
MNTNITLNPNKVVQFLQKAPRDFTKQDIIRFVKENGIEMINFMYPADDNRLKTLNFVVNSEEYLDSILTFGERVDGSSLFPFIEAGNSDLYVIPRFSTAFVDPFAVIPTLTLLCSFFNNEGKPLPSSPEYSLRKALETFREKTGMDFYAMGELEYYVISEDQGEFKATDQKGYHESAPFAKFNDFRTECMNLIARAGGQIKYGHNEVGNFTLNGSVFEQNEIEFLPVYALEAADTLMIAKWVIRTLALKRGYDVTFAPKITEGKAGSGLHIHFKLMDGDENKMVADGKLSDDAKRAIVGILEYADALTAMGNTVPTSYFRLVPHQEAPTSICWGDRNRSVLVRVPLGWTGKNDMCSQANPLEEVSTVKPQKQTVELRSADASANVYQLMAGMVAAALKGFENPDALKRADELYVNVNIHNDENKAKLESLRSLPASCAESARALQAVRNVFEDNGIFSPQTIDGIIRKLESYKDENLRAEVKGNRQEMLDLVNKFWNCG